MIIILHETTFNKCTKLKQSDKSISLTWSTAPAHEIKVSAVLPVVVVPSRRGYGHGGPAGGGAGPRVVR